MLFRSVFPGILLVVLVLSVNLIGEGLRDAVDPKSEVMKRVSLFSRIGRFFSKIFGGAKGGESIRS